MLVDDRPDLQVLMLRRTNKVVFAPDNWVFPGGRVDPEDHDVDFDSVCEGLSDDEASSRLDVDSGGLAWWIACCRETLEEAGLLLTSGSDGVDVAGIRERVVADEGGFVAELIANGLRVNTDLIAEVGRFVTPVGPPRRFDARFFVARAPKGQEPVHDDSEIVDWEWMRPADALRRRAEGDIQMMSPTVRMLDCLAQLKTTQDVLDLAARRLGPHMVRVLDPQGSRRLVLPGESGYSEGVDRVEFGWTRLWDSAR